ncbi:MAG: methyltransferase domain-containing protein [candidate division Zixibacteria bacterium]|nr:methyltransferase domain-containing protein [candidate division Zixibacteria bacterium]
MFSASNEYTECYERMAEVRLRYVREHGTLEEDRLQSEDATIQLIKKYARANDVILDVGIGLARLLEHFPELQRYGVDVSFRYLEEAQKKGIEVCYALIEEMPYKEECFDIVICTDVLEHVTDLNLTVLKILTVLRSDGLLIVRTPFKEDLSWYVSEQNPYKYAHLRTFDENSLRLLFERVFDCDVIEAAFSGYMPYPNRLKYPIPFPRRDFILDRCFSKLRSSFPSAYEKLLRKWYNPLEISVVIRKRQYICDHQDHGQ